LEAVEERETISLGDFARGGNSFVLQVKGNSMIEDHIMDGDFVVCEQTQVANAGTSWWHWWREMKATLKRFYREGSGKVRLQPANSDMAPIMVAASDVKIQGRGHRSSPQILANSLEGKPRASGYTEAMLATHYFPGRNFLSGAARSSKFSCWFRANAVAIALFLFFSFSCLPPDTAMRCLPISLDRHYVGIAH